jgi:hypothetical protein
VNRWQARRANSNQRGEQLVGWADDSEDDGISPVDEGSEVGSEVSSEASTDSDSSGQSVVRPTRQRARQAWEQGRAYDFHELNVLQSSPKWRSSQLPQRPPTTRPDKTNSPSTMAQSWRAVAPTSTPSWRAKVG